jgi:glutamate-5-semialdehyde dehydrogenase
MMNILDRKRDEIIKANKKDLNAFQKEDQALMMLIC